MKRNYNILFFQYLIYSIEGSFQGHSICIWFLVLYYSPFFFKLIINNRIQNKCKHYQIRLKKRTNRIWNRKDGIYGFSELSSVGLLDAVWFHYHLKIRLYITRTYKHKDLERGDPCKNRSSYHTLFLSEKVNWGGPFDEATKPRSV